MNQMNAKMPALPLQQKQPPVYVLMAEASRLRGAAFRYFRQALEPSVHLLGQLLELRLKHWGGRRKQHQSLEPQEPLEHRLDKLLPVRLKHPVCLASALARVRLADVK